MNIFGKTHSSEAVTDLDYWRTSRAALVDLLTALWLDEPFKMVYAIPNNLPIKRSGWDWFLAAAIPGGLLATLLILSPEFIPQFFGIVR